jgi:alkanesulfonate monooxygenase SsuD/methylene tetrahydromethanopterin reductase-like flavin-dependent oxidoreductase (luciferase family)
MKLSISIEGLFGLSWPRWKLLTSEIEQFGFYGSYCSDHFAPWAAPIVDSLDVYIALAYLASHSQQVQMGTMVSPLSMRDPVMMARQAVGIDELSGGRMILGVGAGWNEYEHTTFGYELADIKTRMDRLEEGLEVITRLIRSDEPVTFSGRFFQLREARLLPRPQRPTRIMVAARATKRSLPLVARYADVWNFNSTSVEVFQEQNVLLDDLLDKAGRKPGDVKRTAAFAAFCWRDDDERKRIEDAVLRVPHFAAIPRDDLWNTVRTNFDAIAGSSEQVVERFRALEAAGVEEIVVQYPTPDSSEILHAFGEAVLPHFN